MEAELIYSVQVLITGAQKSDSIIYTYIYMYMYIYTYSFIDIYSFSDFFHYRLLQDNEYSSLSQPTVLKFLFNF